MPDDLRVKTDTGQHGSLTGTDDDDLCISSWFNLHLPRCHRWRSPHGFTFGYENAFCPFTSFSQGPWPFTTHPILFTVHRYIIFQGESGLEVGVEWPADSPFGGASYSSSAPLLCRFLMASAKRATGGKTMPYHCDRPIELCESDHFNGIDALDLHTEVSPLVDRNNTDGSPNIPV